jgi:hypothetical protein
MSNDHFWGNSLTTGVIHAENQSTIFWLGTGSPRVFGEKEWETGAHQRAGSNAHTPHVNQRGAHAQRAMPRAVARIVAVVDIPHTSAGPCSSQGFRADPHISRRGCARRQHRKSWELSPRPIKSRLSSAMAPVQVKKICCIGAGYVGERGSLACVGRAHSPQVALHAR